MAVEMVNGLEYIFAPNPRLQGDDWGAEYPPVVSDVKWLINKYTGEIVPNTVEFASRSDILAPYLGELPKDGFSDVVSQVNETLNHERDDSGELLAAL